MKRILKIKSLWLTVLLLGAVSSSSALTLGKVRGAVLLGQPLSVSIQVQFEPEEDLASICFDADVFYADSRQESSRIKVALEARSPANVVNVRVSSSLPVEEPMVTVELRAGCSQKVSRRYVLLADLPSEQSQTAPMAAATTVLPVRSSDPIQVSLKADKTGPVSALSPGKVGGRVPRAVVAANVSPLAVPVKARQAKTGKPRLKLDLLDMPEGDPVLKSSAELLSVPADTGTRRAEAAAMWKALNTQTQDVLSDARRLQGLQEDLKALTALVVKNQGSLADLSLRLHKAESERFANWLVYGLLALLGATVAGLAYLWRRQQRERADGANWWQGSRLADLAQAPATVPKMEVPEVAPAAASTTPEFKPAAQAVSVSVPALSKEIDIDLSQAHLVLGAPIEPVEARLPERQDSAVMNAQVRAPMRDFSHSMSASLLTLNTQEVFDTRQQAEFFIALGQYEQAIDVLERCIGSEGEASPLVYLDLLQLFHTLARKAEYQKLRQKFNALFSGCVPDYATFSNEGNALETYPEAMASITELWPSRMALVLIEDFLLRSPYTEVKNSFDLCAFRDLLTLHALVKSVMPAQDESTGDAPVPVTDKSPAPLLDLHFPDLAS